jgi:biotin transport system substrate-specific component
MFVNRLSYFRLTILHILCYDPSIKLLEAVMNRSLSTRDIAMIAMSVALIAVCSWISIPMTVPFTMQTFAVCLVTALLGLRRGMWAVLCYILLGAVGAPVFSGFKGGISVLLGPTGGYILGFLFTALIVGLAVQKFGRSVPGLVCAMAAGILVCYAFGTAWFMYVYARKTGPISLGTALAWCVLPYLLPDAAKIALAVVLVRRLSPLVDREVRTA